MDKSLEGNRPWSPARLGVPPFNGGEHPNEAKERSGNGNGTVRTSGVNVGDLKGLSESPESTPVVLTS